MRESEKRSGKSYSRSSAEQLHDPLLPAGDRDSEAAQHGVEQKVNPGASGDKSNVQGPEDRPRGSRERPTVTKRYITRKRLAPPRRPYANTNASLLSVLSTLTGLTAKSSDSGSTLTQATFDQQIARHRRASARVEPLETIDDDDTVPMRGYQDIPRRYQVSAVDSDDREHGVTVSEDGETSEDLAQDWDDTSFERPNTVSSVSSAPSPTETRPTSKTWERRRSSVVSNVSNEPPEQRSSVPQSQPMHPAPLHEERSHRRMPGSYDTDDGGQSLERDPPRQDDHHDMPPPPRMMIRSRSASPTHSERRGRHIEEHVDGDVPVPPGVPDAPDLTKVTMTGYENLAKAISEPENEVTPIYRRFGHLNHRVLLYLQDELSHLEGQLRETDEFIAQSTPYFEDGNLIPSSRRADLYSEFGVHHRRRELLGTIFIKTQEYNRALDLHLSVLNNTTKPKTERVEAYKRFIESGQDIHPMEALFLEHDHDLILVAPKTTQSVGPKKPIASWVRGFEVTATGSIVALSLTMLVVCCLTILRF